MPLRLPSGLLLLAVLLAPSAARAQTFTASNLPILVVTTAGGQAVPDEPKIAGRLVVRDRGAGQRNALTDVPALDVAIGIERRGSTSQTLSPKDPYGIETRDAAGADLDVALLGMPKESDWVLLAPYSDKSLMRDVLAYEIARRTGRYASRFRFVELVLNGDYVGVYVVLEKIKRDKNRVPIAKLNPTDVAGDALTGGYLLKLDKTTGSPSGGWTSPFRSDVGRDVYVQYDDPDEGDLVDVQEAYIRDWMLRFETMLAAPTAPAEYARWIETGSWIDFMIVNELARNVDGYRLSTFFHKQRDSDGGRLVMGPAWDFNIAFGNANYYDGARTAGFQYTLRLPDDPFQTPFWWRALMADANFRGALGTRWAALRRGPLHADSLAAFVGAHAGLLSEAQGRNFRRWPILGTYVWPDPYLETSYADEVAYLQRWTRERAAWLDANFPPPAPTAADGLAAPGDVTVGVPAPNPATGRTTISVTLGRPTRLRAIAYDALGRRVATLCDGDAAGTLALGFDVGALAPGVYVVRIDGEGVRETRRVVRTR